MADARIEQLGRYRIFDVLGEGAMGVVYRAHDTVLDRLVAVKVMTDTIAREPELRERFLREARTAGGLQHPNIVTIYDFGEIDGFLFIAMELVPGVDLSHVVSLSVPLPLDTRLAVVAGMLTGLGYAHKRGVVHRDIKPANVRVTEDGAVKIMDFGIAHMASSELTRTGTTMGTPSYMAPEQVEGGHVTAATDIFAAGVVLYELLSGVKPFVGPTLHSILYKIMSEEPADVLTGMVGMPRALPAIVFRALAKHPGSRYQDALTMARDLNRVRSELSQNVGTAGIVAAVASATAALAPLRTRPGAAGPAAAGPAVGLMSFPPGAGPGSLGGASFPPMFGQADRSAADASGPGTSGAASFGVTTPGGGAAHRSHADTGDTSPRAEAAPNEPASGARAGALSRRRPTTRSTTALVGGVVAAMLVVGGLWTALGRRDGPPAAGSSAASSPGASSAGASSPASSTPTISPPTVSPPAAAPSVGSPMVDGADAHAATSVDSSARSAPAAAAPIKAPVSSRVAAQTARAAQAARDSALHARSRPVVPATRPPVVPATPTHPSAGTTTAVESTPPFVAPRPTVEPTPLPPAPAVPPTTAVTPPSASAVTTPATAAASSVPPAPSAAGVREALDAYARALESRDLGAVKRVYPALTDGQERSWRALFEATRSLDVTLSVGDVSVSGNTATAIVTGRSAFVMTDGHRTTQPLNFRATLRHDGAAWKLASVQ